MVKEYETSDPCPGSTPHEPGSLDMPLGSQDYCTNQMRYTKGSSVKCKACVSATVLPNFNTFLKDCSH